MWDASLPPHILRAGLGLAIGFVVGYAARRGRFCSLGAFEDAIYAGDTRRMWSWGLAIAVATAGTGLLQLVGLDLPATVYGGERLEVGGLVFGGFALGLGVALVGTCPFGSLLRLGGGDLKALVTVLVLAASSFMAMRGLTGIVRVALLDPIAIELPASRGQFLPALLGFGPGTAALLAGAVAVFLATAAFRSAAFRSERRLVWAGIAIGAGVVAGWIATGLVGADPFGAERPVSLSFARPVGETLFYAMLASGLQVDFGVASVAGVVAGAAAAALASGRFRWEAPDGPGEMRRHVLGAFLMGTGGIAALGCTIGQGVTGVATLSVGSLLALAAMAAGARAGLYLLVERGAR